MRELVEIRSCLGCGAIVRKVGKHNTLTEDPWEPCRCPSDGKKRVPSTATAAPPWNPEAGHDGKTGKDIWNDEDLEKCPAIGIRMPFGKHKEKLLGLIYEEDPSYVNWVAQNTDPPIQLSAQQVIEYAENGEVITKVARPARPKPAPSAIPPPVFPTTDAPNPFFSPEDGIDDIPF